jgi:hypothetical protein
MTDFPGIKMTTGYAPDSQDSLSDDFVNETLVLLTVFSEDSLRLGAVYYTHAGRTYCSDRDIGLALKTRALHGEKFWELPEVQERISQITEEFKEDENQMEEVEAELEDDENQMEEVEAELEDDFEHEQWTVSSCSCTVCNMMNDIEGEWGNWEPSSISDISIKNAINKALNKQ